MSNNIDTVRQHLFDTLADLRNREKPMDLDRARAVADVARVLVDTAKVEVDYIKATSASGSQFLESTDGATNPSLPNGITGVRQHRLK